MHLTTAQIFAQPGSLVSLSDITYHSDLEKSTFCNKSDSVSVPFEFYLAIDPGISGKDATHYRDSMNLALNFLEQENIGKKKPSQKISLICDFVYDRYLKEYDPDVTLPVTMQEGRYNSLTAGILSTLILKELDIPYYVMASGFNIFIVSYPGSGSVAMEFPDPGKEREAYSNRYKRNYVYDLRQSYKISETEYTSKSVDEIFVAWTNKAEIINESVLAGMQYYFEAESNLQQQQYKEAYELAKKAYYFYQSEHTSYVLSASLQFLIELSDFENIGDVDMLLKFAEMNTADAELVTEMFLRVISKFQDMEEKRLHCDALYGRLKSGLQDSTMKEQISFRYNLTMSLQYRGSEYEDRYLIAALKVRGDQPELQRRLDNYYYNFFREIYEDPARTIDEIERVRGNAPFQYLDGTLNFFEMLASLKLAGTSYKAEKIREGDQFLTRFEELWSPEYSDDYVANEIAKTYRTLAVYYFYNGNNEKAKSVVDRGLEYVPGNSYLKSAVY
ncbi:MAG: hypothetical protein K9J30_00680 [Bacteroidales bacterium]|nr:hypothetical protein [Bacteroidales bacterium]